MNFRIFLFVLVVCAALSFTQVADLVINPYVSTKAAVNQMDDTEESAIAMRTTTGLMNAYPGLLWGGVALIGFALFAKPITQLLKEKEEKV